MRFPQISLRGLALVVTSLMLVIWMTSGLLTVIVVAAIADLVLRVFESRLARLPILRDEDGGR